MEYSRKLVARVRSFLEDSGRAYYFDKKRGALYFLLPSLCPEFHRMLAYFQIGEDDLQLDVEYPIWFYPEVRLQVKEYIADQSSLLRQGSIQMNPIIGRLCFHTFVDCADGLPGENVLAHALAAVNGMVRLFGSDLFRLAQNGIAEQDRYKDEVDVMWENELKWDNRKSDVVTDELYDQLISAMNRPPLGNEALKGRPDSGSCKNDDQ